MYKTRMDYESPTADVFELRSRGIMCQSPIYGTQGAAGGDQEYNNYDVDF